MKRILAIVVAYALLVTGLWIGSNSVPRVQAQYLAGDPCFGNNVKLSVPINVVTATTTQLVALNATKTIYVCGSFFTVASSATTVATAQFEYGTGASCGTGTTALTGAMGTGTATATNDGEDIVIPGDYTSFSIPVGNALCLVTAGTTVSVQGFVTYIQQ